MLSDKEIENACKELVNGAFDRGEGMDYCRGVRNALNELYKLMYRKNPKSKTAARIGTLSYRLHG